MQRKIFSILAINLNVLHNYFINLTKFQIYIYLNSDDFIKIVLSAYNVHAKDCKKILIKTC